MVSKTWFVFLVFCEQMESKFGSNMRMSQTPHRHCSPPTGSVDGGIVVEDSGGGITDLTTLTWQVALGSTLCYR